MGLVNDDHERDEAGHYIEIRCEYFPNENPDPDAETEYTMGHIETHFHGVPPQMILDSLLLIGREVLEAGMAESMFNEAVPAQVREIAARVMATQFMVARIQSPDIANTTSVSARVPDDISSLLESEG